MNTSDLISVIIPAYNHERYIEECVRSIMAQTYQNLELIFIDDGSTDGTFEKLQALKPECELRFVRVVMIRENHNGGIRNTNAMIDMAQGEFIYSLASDDASKPRAIEVLHGFLSENPDYVLAVGDNEIINGDSERIYWDENRKTVPESEAVYKTFGDDMHINGDNKHPDFGSYEDLLKGNYIPNGYLYSRSAIIDAGKYALDMICEDWYINLQLAKLGKFKYFPEILFSYRWHEANTVSSSGYQSKGLEIYRQIYEHEKEYCFAHGHKKLWKRMWSRRFGWRAKWRSLKSFLRGRK